MSGIRADIHHGPKLSQMTCGEQRKSTLLCIESEPIGRENLRRRNPTAKIAKPSPVLYQVDQAPGQKKFQQPIQLELLDRCRAVLELRENEATGGSLQRARNHNLARLANVRARVIDHDHRTIRQITDRLVRLAAFLD